MNYLLFIIAAIIVIMIAFSFGYQKSMQEKEAEKPVVVYYDEPWWRRNWYDYPGYWFGFGSGSSWGYPRPPYHRPPPPPPGGHPPPPPPGGHPPPPPPGGSPPPPPPPGGSPPPPPPPPSGGSPPPPPPPSA